MSRSGTRRTSILNRRAGQKARLSFWMKRLGFASLLILIGGSGAFYAYHSGRWHQFQIETTEAFHDSMEDHGFAVSNLLIDGRVFVDRDDLKAILNVDRGQSIFEPDLVVMKTKLENLDWVKSAVVERHLPDTLYVHLEERWPLVLWQRKNKLAVVDAEGHVLTEENLSRFKNLLIVVGEDAPHYAPELVAMLEAESDFAQRIESAKWIGGRRWDLFLKNGVEVRLPEEDIGQAIKRLADAQREAQLMDRNVLAIDLRDPMRIIVQTAPGKAEDYQASFRIQKKI
ncbi:MAG: cell division protein FtsQ/DivIB [Alphaproteobacteria bacterium]|nr:cell division protein FtsQ/DivIB [Alphaproteobacteria bacterium]MCB9985174.1 FtsQ-type POTRA domain-containing protein [Micavibrio sp.]